MIPIQRLWQLKASDETQNQRQTRCHRYNEAIKTIKKDAFECEQTASASMAFCLIRWIKHRNVSVQQQALYSMLCLFAGKIPFLLNFLLSPQNDSEVIFSTFPCLPFFLPHMHDHKIDASSYSFLLFPSMVNNMAHSDSIEVIDDFQISLPPGSVPAAAASIPLSFLDVGWILCRQPMQRVFFYDFPHPTPYFIHNILPSLKASLSITLQYFYPFAANLIYPPPPHKPRIVLTDGDSVPFTVAESAVDFDEIIGDHVRDARELHPFVPKLPPSRLAQDGTRMLPLLALQVTLFPDSGLCIGISFRHVAADGMAFNHFVKFWAFIFRSSSGSGGELAHHLEKWLPSHDRTIIKDPGELESVFLKPCWESAPPGDNNIDSTYDGSLADKVRATFAIGKDHIEKLKRRVGDHTQGQLHVSTFAATCAITWVGLIKSEEPEAGVSLDKDKLCYLVVLADCRQRLEIKLPDNYFGNCVGVCYVPVKRIELLSDNGIVVAAKEIGQKVKEYLGGGVLKGAQRWNSTLKEILEEGNQVWSVAGWPRLRVYETDFGWGRPKKSEVVHIDVTGSISISDSRDGEGGVEVGLALTRSKMDVFSAVFKQHLKQI